MEPRGSIFPPRWHPGAALVTALLGVVLISLAGLMLHRGLQGNRRSSAVRVSVPQVPQSEPNILVPLAPAEALAANESRPLSTEPLEAAPIFTLGVGTAASAALGPALECLTAAVYYEAAGEGEKGERAVAQVVLNRVRHPAFPSTVCGVVYQGSERATGCQFTFTCDGSLKREPSPRGWAIAKKVAAAALEGRIEPIVGMATHYHANFVLPYWAPKLDKIAIVGNHIFYRWSGYWGKRSAFNQRYSGEELPVLPVADDPVLVAGDLTDPPAVRPEPPLLADRDTTCLTAPSFQAPAQAGPPSADLAKSELKADQLKVTVKADDGQPIAEPKSEKVLAQNCVGP